MATAACALLRALQIFEHRAAVECDLGVLPLAPTKYGSRTCDLPDGLGTVLGGNPLKDSSFGRKLRAGGGVSFINPGGTYGYEVNAQGSPDALLPLGPLSASQRLAPSPRRAQARCIVIESATTTGPPTVTRGLHFGLERHLPDLKQEIADGTAGGLNIGDATR